MLIILERKEDEAKRFLISGLDFVVIGKTTNTKILQKFKNNIEGEIREALASKAPLYDENGLKKNPHLALI